jgi:hypothetical protein
MKWQAVHRVAGFFIPKGKKTLHFVHVDATIIAAYAVTITPRHNLTNN